MMECLLEMIKSVKKSHGIWLSSLTTVKKYMNYSYFMTYVPYNFFRFAEPQLKAKQAVMAPRA